MLEKLFIPYDEALELKQLGFDEPCLVLSKDGDFRLTSEILKNSEVKTWIVMHPLYSQAFEFFRKKYGLYVSRQPEFYKDGINFNWQILWYLPKEEWKEHYIYEGTFMYGDNNEYPTEEAMELGILLKLIEIAKRIENNLPRNEN